MDIEEAQRTENEKAEQRFQHNTYLEKLTLYNNMLDCIREVKESRGDKVLDDVGKVKVVELWERASLINKARIIKKEVVLVKKNKMSEEKLEYHRNLRTTKEAKRYTKN
jgi:hypothetical protein